MEVDGRQEEIDNSSAALPVNHLLLCLHGIGQNMTGANIAGAFTAPLLIGKPYLYSSISERVYLGRRTLRSFYQYSNKLPSHARDVPYSCLHRYIQY